MASVLTFEFRLGDRRLAESSSDQLSAPIAIGSGETAAWRTPPEDTHAAALEATLSNVRGKAVLTAAPGCSFVRLGKPERKRTLAAGDRISIGDCELTVGAIEQASARRSGFHQLEGLNGEHKGERIALSKPSFLIGSADDCDLKLPLDVVSAHHAEITVEEETGIAWLRDLGSRNGTSVGGTRLGEKPRMLQDGDVVGFAIWDFRFQDRNVRHVESHLGRQLVLVAVTVAAALVAYFLMMARTRSLDECLLAVRNAVRAEQFDEAKAILDTARDCKDADKRADVIAAARKFVFGMASVHADWTAFCALLEERKWDEASDFSGRLPTASPLQWEWDLERRDERLQEARLTKERLDAFIAARRAAEDLGMTLESRREMADRLRQLGVGTPAWTNDAALPPYRMALRCGLAEQLERIDYLVRGLDEVHANLDERIRKKDVSPEALSEFLTTKIKSSKGVLRHMLSEMQACGEKLFAALREERDCRAALAAEDFGFLDRPLALPSVDECLIDPVFVRMRNELQRRDAELRNIAEGARRLLGRLAPHYDAQGRNPVLRRFGDEQLWRRLLACGYWSGPLPKKERPAPVDEFDAALGYDFFYAFMRGAPLVWPADYLQDPACASLSFKPDLVKLVEAYAALAAADAYLSREDVKPHVTGALQRHHDRIRADLKAVQAVQALLAQLAQELDGTRAGEMAFSARLVLTLHAQRTEKDIRRMRDLVRARHSEVLKIVQDYDPLDTKSADGIRKHTFATAIPGDPSALKVRTDR